MIDLLKCEHIGSRQLQIEASRIFKKKTPTVLTIQGKPMAVLVPYKMMVKLLVWTWKYEDLSQ